MVGYDTGSGPGRNLAEYEAILTREFAEGGLLYGLAQAASEGSLSGATPGEIGDILLPPRAQADAYKPRYQLVADSSGVLKEAAAVSIDEIYDLATQLGMRHEATISLEDINHIDSAKAVWVVEAGANRTSIVRRGVAGMAIKAIYADPENIMMFQLGSDRVIATSKPEYEIARQIAPDHINTETALTEYDLNVATARQNGYSIHDEKLHSRDILVGRKQGEPSVAFIQPETSGRGLFDGFAELGKLGVITSQDQLVVASNGQYRPKDELQATRWGEEAEMDMLPPVAVGDEPGFIVEHNGAVLTTAERVPTVYVNEMVILARTFGIA